MAESRLEALSRRVRRARPYLLRWLILPTVALVCALGVNWLFGIRQLDVTFDASSLTLESIDTWQAGHGDEPTIGKAFLMHIERIDSFDAGGNASSKTWKKPEKGPIFPAISLSPGPGRSCTNARIELSRAHESDATVVSLHIPREKSGPCTLLMKAGDETFPLLAGARLDFLPIAASPVLPAQSRPSNVTTTPLMRGVHVRRLEAALEGEIRGLDAGFTCTRGERLDLSGLGLEVVSIRLDATDPQAKLQVWARANLSTSFDLDGAQCAPGLYHPQGPKALTAWAVLLAVLGLGWRRLRPKDKKDDNENQ